MSRSQCYTDMEARYRKQADIEPANREKYLEAADRWRRLADTTSLFSEKQIEMRQVPASLAKQKTDGG